MKKTFLSISMALSLLLTQGQDRRLAGLDSFINHVLKEWHTAGVSIAVVEKNKVIYSRGHGFRNIEKQVPVNDSTLFAIGSCTKAFTSSLLGILSAERKLDLDKPVNSYMPELRFIDDDLTNNITARDMMSHRTGLPRHDMAWYGAPTQRDSLLYRIRFFEKSAQLREKWQYNNFMFLAQGSLAEKLTGKKWEDLIQEKILNPLGMKSTSPYISVMENGVNAAVGYKVKDDSLITRMNYLNIDAVGPAGSLNSSARDMAKWLITWINGGKYLAKEILPASYVNLAMSSQMVANPGLPTVETPEIYFANYGLAWSIASYRGHYRVEHGGNIDGFSATTAFYPADSIGIVVLVNQNRSPVPSIIRNAISDRIFNLSYRNWTEFYKADIAKSRATAKVKRSKELAFQKPGTKLSHALADYTGTYRNPGYGTVLVTQAGDSLTVSFHKLRVALRHFHYDVFSAFTIDEITGLPDPESTMNFSFVMNNKGEIESLHIPFEQTVKDIVFTKDTSLKIN